MLDCSQQFPVIRFRKIRAVIFNHKTIDIPKLSCRELALTVLTGDHNSDPDQILRADRRLLPIRRYEGDGFAGSSIDVLDLRVDDRLSRGSDQIGLLASLFLAFKIIEARSLRWEKMGKGEFQ